MSEVDLELVLGLVARLSAEQRERLRAVLAAGDGEAAIVPVLEARSGTSRPACIVAARRCSVGAGATGCDAGVAGPAHGASTH